MLPRIKYEWIAVLWWDDAKRQSVRCWLGAGIAIAGEMGDKREPPGAVLSRKER